jgi:predicted RNA-binding Zn ribbon-like protein
MWISPVPPDLCLNFANTLSWRGKAEPSEELTTFATLLGWLAQGTKADPETFAALMDWVADRSLEGAGVLKDAIEIREAIYRVFSARAADAAVAGDDLARISAALQAAPARTRLAEASSGYGWVIGEPAPTAPALLAPVLWSAGDLIVGGASVNVRQCANAKCLWLFIDESRNGTRRWCDMSQCGNRAKAQRHYRKSKT